VVKMKTDTLLIIAGLGVAAYFLLGNKSASAFTTTNTTIAGTQTPPTTTTPPPDVIIQAAPKTSTRSNSTTSYDKKSGVLFVGDQGFSVRPENASKLSVQQQLGQAQSVYTRTIVNPYARL